MANIFSTIKKLFFHRKDSNFLRIKEIDKEYGVSVKLVVKDIPDRNFKLHCKRRNIIAEINYQIYASRTVEGHIAYFSQKERFFDLIEIEGDINKLKKNDLLEIVEEDISQQDYIKFISHPTIGKLLIIGSELHKNKIDDIIKNFDDLGRELQADYKARRKQELSEKAESIPIQFKIDFPPNGYIKISALKESWFIKDNKIATDIQRKKFPPPQIVRRPNEVPRPRN